MSFKGRILYSADLLLCLYYLWNSLSSHHHQLSFIIRVAETAYLATEATEGTGGVLSQ